MKDGQPQILTDLLDFEYAGGGYFRHKGFPKGVSAPIIHGPELIELIRTHLQDDPRKDNVPK